MVYYISFINAMDGKKLYSDLEGAHFGKNISKKMGGGSFFISINVWLIISSSYGGNPPIESKPL